MVGKMQYVVQTGRGGGLAYSYRVLSCIPRARRRSVGETCHVHTCSAFLVSADNCRSCRKLRSTEVRVVWYSFFAMKQCESSQDTHTRTLPLVRPCCVLRIRAMYTCVHVRCLHAQSMVRDALLGKTNIFAQKSSMFYVNLTGCYFF